MHLDISWILLYFPYVFPGAIYLARYSTPTAGLPQQARTTSDYVGISRLVDNAILYFYVFLVVIVFEQSEAQ